jgi:hypothetical protein
MIAPPRYCFLSIALMALAFLPGCGGNSSKTVQQPQGTSSLRVESANASEASVNVLVDGAAVVSSVTFLNNTGYISVPAGSHQITLQGWVNPPNATFMATFPENAQSTLFFGGWGPFSSASSIISDDLNPPATGNFKLRIVDTTVSVSFDVYVLPAGTLPGGTPTFSPVTFSENSPSNYVNLPAGSYHVVFTDFQSLNVEFDTGPVAFSAGQNRTLLLINNCTAHTCDFKSFTSMMLADLD